MGKMKLAGLVPMLLSVIMLVVPAAYGADRTEQEPVRVFVNGFQVIYNQLPVVEDGTTLVQFRPSFEALGYRIEWDAEESAITGTLPNKRLELKIGSNTAYLNGEAKELPIAPRIINGSAYVPIRFLGEISGGDVTWNPNTNFVDIVTDKGYYIYSAATGNELDRVRHWLDQGAGSNFANLNSGTFSLGMAIHHKNVEMVKLLLENGAIPDMVNPVYPLMDVTDMDMAIFYQSPEIVKLLIQYGSNANRIDKEGKRPIDRAKEKLQTEKDQNQYKNLEKIIVILENEKNIPRIARYSGYISDGPSMEPTIFSDERLWVDKEYYNTNMIARNDLIVYEGANGKTYIKRVIALPNESLEINGDLLYINRERFTSIVFPDNKLNQSEMKLGEDQVFVIGDNYNHSLDSRLQGPVPITKIIGKVIHIEHLRK
jgi:signal peptidase I